MNNLNEHELHLLGICINFADKIPAIIEKIATTDFQNEDHRRIFSVIIGLHGEGAPVDFTTLGSKLQPADMAICMDAAEIATTGESFDYYVKKLRKASKERKISELALRLSDKPDDPQLKRLLTEAAETEPPAEKKPSRLRAVTIEELLLNEFPKRESLLHPVLHTQSLNMVHAWRGCGKTHFGLGLAYAVASGGRFLKWKAETPRAILYIDGEMPGNSLQDRLAAIVAANEVEPPPGFFRVLTPDLQEPGTMPDLSSEAGQAAVDALVAPETELIIVDNLSCLVRGGKENESESWIPVQGWALRHRAAGRSILFVHHSGKGGEQRGTSKREDVLDLVLKLKRPADYEPSQGACFEVIFEKARHLSGSDTTSFEATLTADETGKQLWVFKDVTETTYERVIELVNIGLNQNDIAHELDINKSSVSRAVKKAKAEGKLPQGTGKN